MLPFIQENKYSSQNGWKKALKTKSYRLPVEMWMRYDFFYEPWTIIEICPNSISTWKPIAMWSSNWTDTKMFTNIYQIWQNTWNQITTLNWPIIIVIIDGGDKMTPSRRLRSIISIVDVICWRYVSQNNQRKRKPSVL